MKKKVRLLSTLMIAMFVYTSSASAQKKDSAKNQVNQVVVHKVKDAIVIQFFYSPNGKFTYSNLDCQPPVFLSQVIYDKWKDLIHDFPSVSKSKDSALVEFNWKKLGKFGKHENWKTIVNNSGGKTYIGNFLDETKNHDADKVKIVAITHHAYIYTYSPDKQDLYIGVYLSGK